MKKVVIQIGKLPEKVKYIIIYLYVFIFTEVLNLILYTIHTKEKVHVISFITNLVIFCCFVFFVHQLKKKKNWARLVLIIILNIKLLSLLISIGAELFLSRYLNVIIPLIQSVIIFLVFINLFSKDFEIWIIGVEKNLRVEAIKSEKKNSKRFRVKELFKTIWFWFIIPISILGFFQGFKSNSIENIFSGILLLSGPYILGISFIVFLILLKNNTKRKSKNDTLILILKICLLLFAHPLFYSLAMIIHHHL